MQGTRSRSIYKIKCFSIPLKMNSKIKKSTQYYLQLLQRKYIILRAGGLSSSVVEHLPRRQLLAEVFNYWPSSELPWLGESRMHTILPGAVRIQWLVKMGNINGLIGPIHSILKNYLGFRASYGSSEVFVETESQFNFSLCPILFLLFFSHLQMVIPKKYS